MTLPRFSILTFALILAGPAPVEAARSCELKSITGGGLGLCFIREDDRVGCFGDDVDFIPLSPAPNDFLHHVSVGSSFACGIRDDASATCWGKHDSNPPELEGQFEDLWVGDDEVWGLRPNGTVVMAYTDGIGPHPTAPEGIFIDIEGTCGRRADKTVDCWAGSTSPTGMFEQLSGVCGLRTNGSITCWDNSWNETVGIAPAGTFTQLSTSYTPSRPFGGCALEVDGSVVCWGPLAVTPPPMGAFREVAAGYGLPCGIRTDTSLECWPDVFNRDFETLPLEGSFVQVAAGGDPLRRPLSCAVDVIGKLACWGNDQFEQTSPLEGTFTQVAVGNYHACALRTEGTIGCWGENSIKDLEAPAGTFTQIAVGSVGPNCALRADGNVACWGFFQTELDVPDGPFTQIAAGGEHACALDDEGEATCWTYAFGGGEPSRVSVDSPGGPFAQITVSGDFQPSSEPSTLMCGLRANASVECWGDDVGGQLDVPDGDFTQVSAGGAGACALRPGGQMECWGGVWEDLYSPPVGEFVQVATGYNHVCGLAADGSVACSGDDHTVSFCGPSALCGNGIIDPPESCDDGELPYEAGNSCTDACTNVPCGQPLRPNASAPAASDALFTLRVAVGIGACALEVCDVNNNGSITAADALLILSKAVNLPVTLNCPT